MQELAALAIDCNHEQERIVEFIRQSLRHLKRRGLVVAISGGIDSSLCLALAVKAVGAERVTALMLPEQDSSSDSVNLAKELCDAFNVNYLIETITPAVEGLGCYSEQTQAIQQLYPNFKQGQAFKLALAPDAQISTYQLIIEEDNELISLRCPPDSFRHIIAATNHKQRARKAVEYFHAERQHYAVVGTPNLLELELGFFVKAGDAIADIKPIAHLYKSQVFALAQHMGVPDRICQASPTTDTFALEQSQEEFFFKAPYNHVDLALHCILNDASADTLQKNTTLSLELSEELIQHIINTRRSATYQKSPALKL